MPSFIIATKHGASGWLQGHPPNSPEYTYIASAISIALDMMNTPTGMERLTSLAWLFDNMALGGRLFRRRYQSAQDFVDRFLEKLEHSFPAVIIDESIASLDLLAYHPRSPSFAPFWDFNTRAQAIFLNGDVRGFLLNTRQY